MISPSVLALLAAAIIAAYLLITAITSWYRLRHFPGPRLASLSNLWLAKTAYSGHTYKIHMALSEKYKSPLIRIGPDTLLTDDPSIIRRINAVRSPYKRDTWYYAMTTEPSSYAMISTTDEAFHNSLRSRTGPAYSGRDVPTLEADVDEQLVAFKELIRRKYVSTEGGELRKMDLGKALPWFTLDSITKISFGNEWGHIRTDSDVVGFNQAVASGTKYAMVCADTAPLRRVVFSWLGLRLMGPRDTDSSGLGFMNGVAKRAVAERFESEKPGEKQDMMGSFIRHGLTQRECAMEIPVVVAAGSDTTAAAMRATLLYIMTTPRVYHRLQAEIDEAVASGKVSTPVISQAQAQTLPYLQAVIHEGLRMHPPVQALFLKAAQPQGDTLDDGTFIPGGTKIGANVWGTMRNREVFGEDVDVFRPERFLDAEKNVGVARRVEMERGVQLVFGNGRYMCAGSAIAWMELGKVYFELLRDFDFQIVDPGNPWNVRQYATFLIKDMWVRVTERARREEV